MWLQVRFRGSILCWMEAERRRRAAELALQKNEIEPGYRVSLKDRACQVQISTSGHAAARARRAGRYIAANLPAPADRHPRRGGGWLSWGLRPSGPACIRTRGGCFGAFCGEVEFGVRKSGLIVMAVRDVRFV